MKVLLLEKNLILLSRIKSSLAGHEVRANGEYTDEDIVLINIEAFGVEKVKELKEKGAKVVAYCGHKNLELMQGARQMGADMVVPNSQIINAGEILKSFLC